MLERFVNDYSAKAFHFAFRLCGNNEEAKEMVQEAFFRVAKKWDQYDASQPLENWFFTILRNVYMDGLKRYERRNGVSLDLPLTAGEEAMTLADALPSSEEALLTQMERLDSAQQVRRVLESLKVEHKALLTLCDMQGLSYEEIARVLDCPPGTVRSRISRARAAFREKMSEMYREVVL